MLQTLIHVISFCIDGHIFLCSCSILHSVLPLNVFFWPLLSVTLASTGSSLSLSKSHIHFPLPVYFQKISSSQRLCEMFLYGEESLELHQTPNSEASSFICNLQICHVVVTGTHYHCGTDTLFILLFIRNQRGQRWHGLQGHFLVHSQ